MIHHVSSRHYKCKQNKWRLDNQGNDTPHYAVKILGLMTLSKTPFYITTLDKISFGIMANGIMTLSIMTVGIMTRGIATLGIMTQHPS